MRVIIVVAIAWIIRCHALETTRPQIRQMRVLKAPRPGRSEAQKTQADGLESGFEATDTVSTEVNEEVEAAVEAIAPALTSGEPIPERRLDEDGGAYTKEEFASYYGEDWERVWQAAEVASEEVSYAVELARLQAEDAQKSALARLRRSAMKEISKLRQVLAETTQSAVNKTAALADLAAEFAGFKVKVDGELSAAADRAALAERQATEALLLADAERTGRLEMEAAVTAAQAAAREAEAAAHALEAAGAEAAAASALALGAAEARAEEQAVLARAALAEREAAEARASKLVQEQSTLREHAVQAEARAADMEKQLAEAMDEVATARRALAAAEQAAASSAQEVGVWRRRARMWRRRADSWLRGATSAADSVTSLSDDAIDEAPHPQLVSVVLSAIAVLALAERQALELERDAALAKWSALLQETKQAKLKKVGRQQDETFNLLQGRSQSVMREAEAWAMEEISRLRAKYRGRWEASTTSFPEDGKASALPVA